MTAPSASIPERPLLKPWYRLLFTPAGLLLEHGRSVVTFSGSAARSFLPALLPLLDGSRTVAGLVDAVGSNVAPAVENALSLLAAHDLITNGPALDDQAAAGRRATVELLAAETGASPSSLCERLENGRVQFLAQRSLDERLARILHESGLDAVGIAQGDEITPEELVVLSVPPEPAQLDDWNRTALERGITWLPFGSYDGRTATIGPPVVPHETACVECLHIRRRSTSGCQAELSELRHVSVACAPSPDLEVVVAGLAARIVLRWLLLRDPLLPGLLVTIDGTSEPIVSTHLTLRVPRCPACSGLSSVAPPAPWHEPGVQAAA